MSNRKKKERGGRRAESFGLLYEEGKVVVTSAKSYQMRLVGLMPAQMTVGLSTGGD